MYLITGGGTGLGKALALELAGRGLEVLIIGRRKEMLEEVAALSNKITYLVADVGTKAGRNAIVAHLKNTDTLAGLINNAGTLEPLAPLAEISEDAWHDAFHTNLDAALFLPQALYPQLEGGRVLNVGTGAAYFPIAGWAAYCSSKASLAMLTRCWQLESEEVAFASVMPGIADTAMQETARSAANPDSAGASFYQDLKDKGLLAAPEVVALFLAWLLLDTDKETFISQEWDIYDEKHHLAWLKSQDALSSPFE